MSNFNAALSDQLNFSAGVDARHYTGSHYRTIGDMFGADYYDAPDDRRDQNSDFDTPLRTGDKYYYYDDGQVAWGGSYFQFELDKYNYSAFINVSGAQSWYRAIDYFRPNVVTLNDTTYEVRSTDEYRVLGETEWLMDTTFLTADHPGLTTYTTDWQRLNSATIKAGGNYNFSEWVNAYTNVGYLNRAPLFNSVFDINNNLIEGYENQYVKAVEAGVKYAKGNFASNINAYRTAWENKPVNRFYGVSNLWQDPNLSVYADTSTVAGREAMIDLAESNASADEWGEVATSVIDDVDRNLGYNLLNADAVHSGVEWDFSYDPTSKLNIQGVVSAGELALDQQRKRGPHQPHHKCLHHPRGRRRDRGHVGQFGRGEGGRCRPAPNFFGVEVFPHARHLLLREKHLLLAALCAVLPWRRHHGRRAEGRVGDPGLFAVEHEHGHHV